MADDGFLSSLLKQKHYDAIVDFIHYVNPEEYRSRCELLLNNTEPLIFLSSYRIFANREHPVRETSPQLLDVCANEHFLMENDDFGIRKSSEERILRQSGWNNWTIVRPLISFSH